MHRLRGIQDDEVLGCPASHVLSAPPTERSDGGPCAQWPPNMRLVGHEFHNASFTCFGFDHLPLMHLGQNHGRFISRTIGLDAHHLKKN